MNMLKPSAAKTPFRLSAAALGSALCGLFIISACGDDSITPVTPPPSHNSEDSASHNSEDRISRPKFIRIRWIVL